MFRMSDSQEVTGFGLDHLVAKGDLPAFDFLDPAAYGDSLIVASRLPITKVQIRHSQG